MTMSIRDIELFNRDINVVIPEPTPEEETQQILDEVAEQEETESNLSAYEALSLEDFREMVRTLDESRPVQLDVSRIPPGMSLEHAMDLWNRTGVVVGADLIDVTPGESYRVHAVYGGIGYVVPDFMTATPTNGSQTTGSSDWTTATNTTNTVEKESEAEPETEAVKKEVPEAQLPFGPEPSPEFKREQARIRKIAEEKDNGRIIQLRRIRREESGKYKLGLDEMFISWDHNYNLQILHTYGMKSGLLEEMTDWRTEDYHYNGSNRKVLTDNILFDKNMNPLQPNLGEYGINTKFQKVFTRVNLEGTRMSSMGNTRLGRKKYIIVNRKALIESKGKDFRVRFKVDTSYDEIKAVRNKIVTQLEEVRGFMDRRIKSTISDLYGEENYDIIFAVNFTDDDAEDFSIFTQFPDLKITNSIEIDHKIHNLVTRLDGTRFRTGGMRISSGLYGSRTTFNAYDGHFGYCHSHLPGGTSSIMDGFCMGDGHFLSELEHTTSDIEFDGIMMAMLDHISWESLEGGPYYKMETIGNGNNGNINPDETTNLRRYNSSGVRYLLNIIKNHENFEVLMNAFTLTMRANNEVGWTVDMEKFIRIIIGMFSSDTLEDFCADNDYERCAYVPDEQEFVHAGYVDDVDEDGERTPHAGSWEEMVINARSRVSKQPILYIDGKHVRPKVVETNNPSVTVRREIPCIHPTVIYHIAKVIQYHLTKELKNVK